MKKIYILHSLISKKTLNINMDKILLKIEKTKTPRFEIKGNDILKYGIKNGPKIGKILKIIEARWIENNFKITNNEIKILISNNTN